MLLFEPIGRPENEDNDFYVQRIKNICVGCGEKNHYQRYWIIPSCYRMHFPEHLKGKRSHDIVLLCVDCHEIAFFAAEKYKKQIANEYNISLFVRKIVDKGENEVAATTSPSQFRNAATTLLRYGSSIPLERRTELAQTDLEETKLQEVAKLQNMLNPMQLQIEETNSTLIKEREDARKAIEEAPQAIKETPVLIEDTEKIDSLTSEVENLKALLRSERQKTDSTKEAYTEVLDKNAQVVKKLEDAETKVDQLQESVQRLEEKVSNLESENQVLRQQALDISPTGRALSIRPKTTIIQQRTPENGNISISGVKLSSVVSPAVSNPKDLESEEMPQKKTRTCLFSASHKILDSLREGLSLLASYTNAFYTGDRLKLKGQLFLIV